MKIQEEPRRIVWSYGGGTQSLAMLVLIAQGRLPKPELVVMADTGREVSETWAYHAAYGKPLMDSLGIEFAVAGHELATVDLYSKQGDLLLPVFTAKGKMPTFCSFEWKRRVVQRLLRKHGYGPARPVSLWLGMSLDEVGRMRTSEVWWLENNYPLIFDVKLRRFECVQLVADFGLPTPPRSACWMCPHRKDEEWRRLREQYPEDWQQALQMDELIRVNDREHAVYLHRSARPLIEANLDGADDDGQLSLFGGVDGCDSGGFCFV